jgi:thymidylate synthase
MLADEVNMVPLELIGSLGDTHIYENQIEGVREQLSRKTHPLPTVHVRDGIWSTGEEDILLLNYVSEDKIHFPLSN